MFTWKLHATGYGLLLPLNFVNLLLFAFVQNKCKVAEQLCSKITLQLLTFNRDLAE